jgi:hypothetical protein
MQKHESRNLELVIGLAAQSDTSFAESGLTLIVNISTLERRHNSICQGYFNTMQEPLPLPMRRQQLLRLVNRLERGDRTLLPHLDAPLSDEVLIGTFNDAELKDLILVVKHHRPELALVLLTHIKTAKERQSLGNCLAALWSKIDINAAWRAISASSLPESERLALRSAMV